VSLGPDRARPGAGARALSADQQVLVGDLRFPGSVNGMPAALLPYTETENVTVVFTILPQVKPTAIELAPEDGSGRRGETMIS
jgi:hypothetical protein